MTSRSINATVQPEFIFGDAPKVLRFSGQTFGELRQRLEAAHLPGCSNDSFMEVRMEDGGFVCLLEDEILPEGDIFVTVHSLHGGTHVQKPAPWDEDFDLCGLEPGCGPYAFDHGLPHHKHGKYFHHGKGGHRGPLKENCPGNHGPPGGRFDAHFDIDDDDSPCDGWTGNKKGGHGHHHHHGHHSHGHGKHHGKRCHRSPSRGRSLSPKCRGKGGGHKHFKGGPPLHFHHHHHPAGLGPWAMMPFFRGRGRHAFRMGRGPHGPPPPHFLAHLSATFGSGRRWRFEDEPRLEDNGSREGDEQEGAEKTMKDPGTSAEHERATAAFAELGITSCSSSLLSTSK